MLRTDIKRVAKRVKREMRRQRLTIYAVATAAGIKWARLRDLLEGRRDDMSVSTLVRLAQAVGLDPCELLAEAMGGER